MVTSIDGLRVLLIAPTSAPVPPTLVGSVQQDVDLLAVGLHVRGVDVTLACTAESTCDVPRWSLLERAEISQGVSQGELRHIRAAYEYASREGFDVVHDHTLFGAMYAERHPELRVVVTVYTPLDVAPEYLRIYQRISRRAPLVAVSHAQRDRRPDVPIARVIHHGLDAARFVVGSGRGGYALFLGRMVREKGAHDAIDACRAAGVPIKLGGRVATDEERAYFDREIVPRLGDGVEFLGEIGGAVKQRTLGEAEVVVVPSSWGEPLAIVPVEAYACGTPVIAYRDGGIPELVDDGVTGFLCDDVAGMTAALARRGELDRAACRAKVQGELGVERLIDDHVELYRDLVDGRLGAAAAVASAR